MSSFGENKPGNRVVVSSVGCFVVQLRNIFQPGMTAYMRKQQSGVFKNLHVQCAQNGVYA